MKSQIALEFLIMLSFVLIVFVFLLYTITSQRAVGLSSQSFSQLQLSAQSISLQLTKASAAGSGYSGQIPTYSSLDTKTYNITITKNGLVILQQKIGSQVIQAVSYSDVEGIMSSPQFLSSAGNAYLIPASNGTISVQNSFGTLCIDYICPLSNSTPSQISLSSQNTYAAQFTGAPNGCLDNGYVPIQVHQLSATSVNAITISWWVNQQTSLGTVNLHLASSNSNSGGTGIYCGILSGTSTMYCNVPDKTVDGPIGTSAINQWDFETLVLAGGSSGTATLYTNGVPGTAVSGVSSLLSGITDFDILGYEPTCTDWTDGLMSNVQIYNTTLSSSQVQALYSQGIASQPILPADTVGWWPLNGNANDYSGNNNNGKISGVVPFVSVSEIFAKVLSAAGQPVNSLLVGFSATVGSLSNFGSGISSFNYTNSNGVATAFLNSNFTSGQSIVRASAFNGNSAVQGNLLGWWPLNMGQGNVIPDESPTGEEGLATNGVSWNSPNYAAAFGGSASYIDQESGFQFMNNAVQNFAFSIWVDPTSSNGVIISENYATPPSASSWHDSWMELVDGNVYIRVWGMSCIDLGPVPLNSWSNIVMSATSSGSSLNLNGSIDGVTVNAETGTRSTPGGSSLMYYPLGTSDATNCGSGASYQGEMSNFQVYNTALSPSQIRTIYSSGVMGAPVAPSNLALWYPLNGNANDYSGNNNPALISGNVQFVKNSAPQPQLINQSSVTAAKFNGASSYINTGTTNLPLGSNARSVFAWVYFNGTSSSDYAVDMYGTDGSPNEYSLMWISSGDLSFSGYSNDFKSTLVVSPGKWHFIGYTYSTGSNSITLYLDGQSQSSAISVLNTVGSLSDIGAIKPASNPRDYFKGSISNLQIYNTSISAQQVQSLYQEGLEGLPLTSQGLVGYFPLDGNANDYSEEGNNGAATNVIYTSQSNFAPSGISALGTYGINLNGVNGNILASNNAIAVGSQITLVVWANRLGNGNQGSRGIMLSQGATYIDTCWLGTALFSADNSIVQTTTSGGGCPALGSWTQYVATYNGINTELYLDGVLVASGAMHGAIQPGPVTIGQYSGGSYNFNGSIADVQIYNVSMTAQQVAQLYDSNMPATSSINVPVGWLP